MSIKPLKEVMREGAAKLMNAGIHHQADRGGL